MPQAPQNLRDVISYGVPAGPDRCIVCFADPSVLLGLCADCLAQEHTLPPQAEPPPPSIDRPQHRYRTHPATKPPLRRRHTWLKELEPAFAYTSSRYDPEGCALPLYIGRPALSGAQLRAHAGTARNFALLEGILLPGFTALWAAEIVGDVEPKPAASHTPSPSPTKKDTSMFYDSLKWDDVVVERGRQYACQRLPAASLTELLVDMDLTVDGKGQRGLPLASVCTTLCVDADGTNWSVLSRRKNVRPSGQWHYVRYPLLPRYQMRIYHRFIYPFLRRYINKTCRLCVVYQCLCLQLKPPAKKRDLDRANSDYSRRSAGQELAL